MAGRGKTSPAEDIMDLVAMLPWWVGVMLALVSYLLLHSVASRQMVATVQPGQVGAMVTQTLWKTVANFGQYILPLLCLSGAGMSAWRRRARQNLVADVAQSKATDALDGMSWRGFEILVGEGFRLQGYQVVETGGGGADGGVDLVLTKPGKNGGEKFLVQCKQWRALKVGVDIVRELYGVMAARGATGGFVVTSGRFTDEAISFASGRNVNLVDGPKLHGLIRQAKDGIDRSPARSSSSSSAAANPAVPPNPAPVQAASCSLCSKPLVRRNSVWSSSDQVWFTEKDESQATRLYPLSDFSPRKHEARERGYLMGRYGAVPMFRDLPESAASVVAPSAPTAPGSTVTI